MKKPLLFAATLYVSAALAGTYQHQRDSLLALLPPADGIQGLSRIDSARIYSGKDLYLFIDGGADLFLEYGFRQALAVEYQNVAGGSITLEIYEMSDPGAACGIYSIRSDEESARIDIGQGGSAHAYYIMFWKGRFYVSVAASDSTQQCRKGLEAVARAVDGRVSERGERPRVLELLPQDNVLKQRYFRGYLGLSSVHFLDVKEIFPVIDGAIGTYHDHMLMFMRYSNAPHARHRMADVLRNLKTNKRFKHYRSQGQLTSVVDGNDQTLGLSQSGPYLILSVSSSASTAITSCRAAVVSLRAP